jgi:hypothetical protein
MGIRIRIRDPTAHTTWHRGDSLGAARMTLVDPISLLPSPPAKLPAPQPPYARLPGSPVCGVCLHH